MIAFLEKLAECNGFQEIIDFMNANQIHYALTVNPTIYTSCIEQICATAKAKTINGECQLQALVDKKKVIITETSIRSDLHLEDAGDTDCLPTATIFEELARMRFLIWRRQRMLKQRRLLVKEEGTKVRKEKEIKNYRGRSFEDIDKDPEVSLVDETQRRLDDAEMFDTDDLHGDEVIMDMAVVTTASEGVTATKIDEITTTSAPIIAID
ncbi:hypothetical protein Tco_1405895 [Tanacetum coccineum]